MNSHLDEVMTDVGVALFEVKFFENEPDGLSVRWREEPVDVSVITVQGGVAG